MSADFAARARVCVYLGRRASSEDSGSSFFPLTVMIRCDSFSPKKVCALSEHTLPDVLAPVAEQQPEAPGTLFSASLFVNKWLHVNFFFFF